MLCEFVDSDSLSVCVCVSLCAHTIRLCIYLLLCKAMCSSFQRLMFLEVGSQGDCPFCHLLGVLGLGVRLDP